MFCSICVDGAGSITQAGRGVLSQVRQRSVEEKRRIETVEEKGGEAMGGEGSLHFSATFHASCALFVCVKRAAGGARSLFTRIWCEERHAIDSI